MKRIWFIQQKPFGYMPLRVGLGLITQEELKRYNAKLSEERASYHLSPDVRERVISHTSNLLCPKVYTTRTHRLSGEYYVVEGSRFNAKPVEPRIEFRVAERFQLRLDTGYVNSLQWFGDEQWHVLSQLNNRGVGDYTFAELDLGFRGATFDMLRDELLRLNPKATIDTPFYVSCLEPIKKEE